MVLAAFADALLAPHDDASAEDRVIELGLRGALLFVEIPEQRVELTFGSARILGIEIEGVREAVIQPGQPGKILPVRSQVQFHPARGGVAGVEREVIEVLRRIARMLLREAAQARERGITKGDHCFPNFRCVLQRFRLPGHDCGALINGAQQSFHRGGLGGEAAMGFIRLVGRFRDPEKFSELDPVGFLEVVKAECGVHAVGRILPDVRSVAMRSLAAKAEAR